MQRLNRACRDGREGDGREPLLSFGVTDDGDGIEVFDSIERHRCELRTAGAVSPTPADTGEFVFPVTEAIEVTTSAVELPTGVGVSVRDEDGEAVATVEHFADEAVPPGSYVVELPTAIKIYLRVDGPLVVESDLERTRIEFDGETRLRVGARSLHDRPAATITTTDDPVDMMTAVSQFGSALKTLSPERSYPTLRGHPPTVELGDELHVPESLDRPETGVRLEIPPDYRSVYVAAPLAYYLGAAVVPGEEPRLVTDAGFEHPLDGPRGFEAEVERVLKQTFFLDCLTRNEGYYSFELHEQATVDDRLDLDFEALYDRSLAEQVEAYLRVPYETVEAGVPEWKLTTHVTPTPDSVEMLPFLVDDLAVVRSPKAREAAGSTDQLAAVNDFLRDDDFTRSASGSTGSVGPATLRPEQTDSLEQAWIGSGAPVGASKPTVQSFRNRLDRSPADGDIDITVVCNDPEMVEERDAVDEVYGSREDLPFDVTVVRELSTAGLRETLRMDVDFLHYIGHIDDEGFQCVDGKLDATGLDEVGVDAFFLNACQSYEQGLALIDAGAIGGVVTLRDVINSGAVKIGGTLSRLLNRGFPLRAGLDITSEESIIGSQYVVVGDGGLAVTQAESGTPYVCEVERVGEEYDLSIRSYPTSDRGMGCVAFPHVDGKHRYFLNSGELGPFSLSEAGLREFLELEEVPVRLDGELRWSDEIRLDGV